MVKCKFVTAKSFIIWNQKLLITPKYYLKLEKGKHKKKIMITKKVYWRLSIYAINKKIANKILKDFKTNIDNKAIEIEKLSLNNSFDDNKHYDITLSSEITANNLQEIEYKSFKILCKLDEGPWYFHKVFEDNETEDDFEFEAILNKEYKFENNQDIYEVRFYTQDIGFILTIDKKEMKIFVKYFPFDSEKIKASNPNAIIEVIITEDIKEEDIKTFNLPLTQEDIDAEKNPEINKEMKDKLVKDTLRQKDSIEGQ